MQAMTEKNNQGRMVLLLIIGFPLTMILAATWLWYFVVEGDLDLVGALGTANHGTLLQPPRQMDDQVLRDATGRAMHYKDLPPRWTMVIPGAAGRCDEACEKNLYQTRQIHTALGRYYNSLQRLYVSEGPVSTTRLAVQQLSDGTTAPDSFADYLEKEHSGLLAWAVEPAAHDTLFAEFSADETTWYLVDPAGWVMMAYNREVSYKEVIADLKFLLKNSGG